MVFLICCLPPIVFNASPLFLALAHVMPGWMNPSFKRNGKKLVPNNSVVVKFMVPLVLWLAAVVAIYGELLPLLGALNIEAAGTRSKCSSGTHALANEQEICAWKGCINHVC
jgi:hypothetical protein